MMLTTLIALWAGKGSFKYSADKKAAFCPASACWDTNSQDAALLEVLRGKWPAQPPTELEHSQGLSL